MTSMNLSQHDFLGLTPIGTIPGCGVSSVGKQPARMQLAKHQLATIAIVTVTTGITIIVSMRHSDGTSDNDEKGLRTLSG